MPDERERLLQAYDALEDAIEETALEQTWELADWLLANVPPSRPGPRPAGDRGLRPLSMGDLVERRGRSKRWLQRMRQVAEVTTANRIPGVTLTAYYRALDAHDWDLEAANSALAEPSRVGLEQREQRALENASTYLAQHREQVLGALEPDDLVALAEAVDGVAPSATALPRSGPRMPTDPVSNPGPPPVEFVPEDTTYRVYRDGQDVLTFTVVKSHGVPGIGVRWNVANMAGETWVFETQDEAVVFIAENVPGTPLLAPSRIVRQLEPVVLTEAEWVDEEEQ
jgi:hypothetical protein